MSFAEDFRGKSVLSDAEFSPCRTWRYTLVREWEALKRKLVCCLLNPSKADHETDDNTVKVLMSYALRLGYGGIVIVNPWAYVSTNPAALADTGIDVIGPDNDWHITNAILLAAGDVVLCGWGDAGAGKRTDSIVREIASNGVRPVCIAVTKSGNPGHPLRKRLPTQPFDWRKTA